MAGLRKLRGRYYARVSVPQYGERAKEKIIPLNTDSVLTARKRKSVVESVESEIRSGQSLTFPWRDGGEHEVEVNRLLMDQAITDYLKARKGDGLRIGTLNLYESALNDFKKIAGKRLPVEEIKLSHITGFKTKHSQLSPHTINMRLRAIKTFLLWLRDNEQITVIPKIKMQNVGKPLPIYITNSQFLRILEQVDKLPIQRSGSPDLYKRAFLLYRNTGMRLAEPFIGELNGAFLTISAETAKGHSQRDIHLNPEQIHTLMEMREYVDNQTAQHEKNPRTGASRKWAIKRFSRVFYDACCAAGIKDRKFHSLRHTAAVRLYLSCRDIYSVMGQLGHSSIATTEIYTKFDIKRLEQDFPDLVNSANPANIKPIDKGLIKGIFAKSDTELTDTGIRGLA